MGYYHVALIAPSRVSESYINVKGQSRNGTLPGPTPMQTAWSVSYKWTVKMYGKES